MLYIVNVVEKVTSPVIVSKIQVQAVDKIDALSQAIAYLKSNPREVPVHFYSLRIVRPRNLQKMIVLDQ